MCFYSHSLFSTLNSTCQKVLAGRVEEPGGRGRRVGDRGKVSKWRKKSEWERRMMMIVHSVWWGKGEKNQNHCNFLYSLEAHAEKSNRTPATLFI